MAEQFPNLVGGVDVIGFGLQGDDGEALGKIAAAGKGQFYDAKSTKELLASIDEVRRDVVAEPEAPPVDLSPIDKAQVAKLRDPDRDVRIPAADALKKRKVAAAVPYLVQVLQNNEWDGFVGETLSRDAAYEAIKELAPDQLEGAVLSASDSDNENVRAWATRKLGE